MSFLGIDDYKCGNLCGKPRLAKRRVSVGKCGTYKYVPTFTTVPRTNVKTSTSRKSLLKRVPDDFLPCSYLPTIPC